VIKIDKKAVIVEGWKNNFPTLFPTFKMILQGFIGKSRYNECIVIDCFNVVYVILSISK
jgi:hypothetical protein